MRYPSYYCPKYFGSLSKKTWRLRDCRRNSFGNYWWLYYWYLQFILSPSVFRQRIKRSSHWLWLYAKDDEVPQKSESQRRTSWYVYFLKEVRWSWTRSRKLFLRVLPKWEKEGSHFIPSHYVGRSYPLKQYSFNQGKSSFHDKLRYQCVRAVIKGRIKTFSDEISQDISFSISFWMRTLY